MLRCDKIQRMYIQSQTRLSDQTHGLCEAGYDICKDRIYSLIAKNIPWMLASWMSA